MVLQLNNQLIIEDNFLSPLVWKNHTLRKGNCSAHLTHDCLVDASLEYLCPETTRGNAHIDSVHLFREFFEDDFLDVQPLKWFRYIFHIRSKLFVE